MIFETMNVVSPWPDREEHGPKQLRAGFSVHRGMRFAAHTRGYSSPFPAAGCVWKGRSLHDLAEKAGRSMGSLHSSNVQAMAPPPRRLPSTKDAPGG